MPKIFISYRRDDCQGTADFLYSLLEDHFDSGNVFFDVDSIDPGRNYVEYLDEQVSQCNVLLALIGKRWITAEDNDGKMRLFNENDFVRKEITSAMDQGITVIPLLVERAEIPKKEMLPEALHKFCDQQATHVRPSPDFKKDVAKLIKDLERIELAEDKPSPDEQAIELAIRFELKKPTGKLTAVELNRLTRLRLHRQGLTEVSALVKFERLKILNLSANQITDVGPLKELTQLEKLFLYDNQISDVSALKDLTQLKKLWLGCDWRSEAVNQIRDISPLKELKQLTELDLSRNQITDVSALVKLTHLEKLSLLYNPNLIKAEIDNLQKALPNCKIAHSEAMGSWGGMDFLDPT